MSGEARLTCDMQRDCAAPVTHIDRGGYVYCTRHGLQRRSDQPCRKLQPAELKRLQAGEALNRY
jgi:hypothetical protein